MNTTHSTAASKYQAFEATFEDKVAGCTAKWEKQLKSAQRLLAKFNEARVAPHSRTALHLGQGDGADGANNAELITYAQSIARPGGGVAPTNGAELPREANPQWNELLQKSDSVAGARPRSAIKGIVQR